MAMTGEGGTMEPNGNSSASYSNGSTSAPSLSMLSSGVTNGHKSAVAVNGSSNKDKGRSQTYHGHDREEVTRLLIQALSDMGYQSAAENVSQQSGYELESPTVARFRSAVLNGSWAVAEQLLAGASREGLSDEPPKNSLVLAHGVNPLELNFWIRQQKFLELLEKRDTTRALMVLRGELTPLSQQETTKLHFLSSLLMCRTTEDLMAKADWDGAKGESRRRLLSQLSKCISPSVMLPESRLAVLLNQVKQSQIDSCLFHTEALSPSLYSDHQCDRRHFPTESAIELDQLHGEVWQVQFSHDGTRLAASGIATNVLIWDTTTWTVVHDLSGHASSVGNFAWSLDDSMIVTCSQDKHARIWDAKRGTLMKELPVFGEPVSACVFHPDKSTFTLGSLGRRMSICTYDIRTGLLEDWGRKHRVQDLCGSPDGRWLVAVDDQQTIHVYNWSTREPEFTIDLKSRPTSVSMSQDSLHLLVNKQDGEAQLIDLDTRASVQKFFGHKGGDYLIRASFGGANESFVVSGSEDGNVLIWHKNTGAAVERLAGHDMRCNAVAWSPTNPMLLASASDDGQVQIWSSLANAIDMRRK